MNAFDLATLVFRSAIIAPGKALSTKPAGGSGDLTFSRAGSADRINAQGNTETMGPNKLRIDYRFPLDGDNSCTGVPIAPVALVESAEGEVLSISDLVAGGFTFDDCTVFYVDNFQRVVKVYTSDGNCKTWVDGNEIGAVVEAKPDSLSWPAGDYSTLQQLVIIRVALSDAEALALSENALLDTYNQTYLSAYVQLLVNGFSIESASRTLSYSVAVNGLFAQGFRTFLAPGAGKAGIVSFIKYTEQSGEIVLPGDLIEGNFSRPDVGATSGSLVFNSGGKLVELLEDVPDLSYPLGEDIELLMRPQAATLVSSNADPDNWYNDVLTPIKGPEFELYPSAFWGKYTQSGTNNNCGFVYGGFSGGESWVLVLYVMISQSGDYIGVRETSAGIGVVRLSTQTVTTPGGGVASVQVQDTVNPDIKRVVIKGVSVSGGNIFLQLPGSTGNAGVDDGNTMQIALFNIVRSSFDTGDFITTGANITRSANQFTLNDLDVNSVIGGDGSFSVLFYTEGYQDGGLNGDTAIRFLNSLSNSVFEFWGFSDGFVLRDATNNTYPDVNLKLKQFVLAFDGQNIKLFDSSGERLSYDFAATHLISDLVIRASDNTYKLIGGSVAFIPGLVSEAAAIAAINHIQNL